MDMSWVYGLPLRVTGPVIPIVPLPAIDHIPAPVVVVLVLMPALSLGLAARTFNFRRRH